MPADYAAIKAKNRDDYGKAVGNWAPKLLGKRYEDCTHFIFEVLQNAEDALRKRGEWTGQRSVEFSLSDAALTISHYGKPFDEADVRGVCGIGESTKEYTDIGRFGIGFKSVYAFTETPEIHSGEERFAIDSYVWPRAVAAKTVAREETQFHIPFKEREASAKDEVLEGLQRIGPRTLLFLREIEEIAWSVNGKEAGRYRRSDEVVPFNGARKVRVVGWDDVSDEITEEWLVFSREVFHEEKSAGHVEIAFVLDRGEDNSQNPTVKKIEDSQLVVFFPTALPTHLGFLLQGPYRTTPSRDNVPERDDWNQYLVRETATLLVEALKGLRKLGLLSISALECLPLSSTLFSEGRRLAPLFQSVKDALLTERLLPAHTRGYITARNAKLSRTQELRSLIGPKQLAALFPDESKPAWLSDDITANRAFLLRNYLTEQLEVAEVTTEWLIPRLTREFLEAQSDAWIARLYEFLNRQRSLLNRLRPRPLIRLEDGSHTAAYVAEKPQAYLPGNNWTGFRTVKRSVCKSASSLAFLRALDLRTPDPVDDVIANIIPKYIKDSVNVSTAEYQSDLELMLTALDTDSAAQRNSLIAGLREAKFIAAVDVVSKASRFVKPREAYVPTERLKALFEGVPGVLIVDDSRRYLRGERVRGLLRAVGTPETLLPSPVKPSLTGEEKFELRNKSWTAGITREISVQDHTLMGLDLLLATLSNLPVEQAVSRAQLLWQTLGTLPNAAFSGTYRWVYYVQKSEQFPARFIKTLNEVAWVPDEQGELHRPSEVVFKNTGWEENPSLFARIPFKPDVLNELAIEAGIEADALALLKRRGITTESQLIAILGTMEAAAEVVSPDSLADKPEPQHPVAVPVPASQISTPRPAATPGSGQNQSNAPTGSGTVSRPTGYREFVTYVKASPDEADADPDGLTYQARMSLEKEAIAFILSKEPSLQRTPPGNPGFDLYEAGPDGQAVRWVEVKAMSGTFDNRPATLTKTQFEFAQKRQNDFWLYVVENAGDPAQSRIVKIQNPAGKAQTFTFDRGWVHLAE